MEFFLPSLFLILLAFTIIFVFFVRMSVPTLFLVAVVALVVAIYTHYSTFKADYAAVSWTEATKKGAPFILVGIVILFGLGYVLYLFGARRNVGLNIGQRPTPSPSTATNYLTQAIETGIQNISSNAFNTKQQYNIGSKLV